MRTVLSPLQGLEQQYPNGIPELDPAEDFQVEEPEALAAAAKLGSLQARLRRNPVYQVHLSTPFSFRVTDQVQRQPQGLVQYVSMGDSQ